MDDEHALPTRLHPGTNALGRGRLVALISSVAVAVLLLTCLLTAGADGNGKPLDSAPSTEEETAAVEPSPAPSSEEVLDLEDDATVPHHSHQGTNAPAGVHQVADLPEDPDDRGSSPEGAATAAPDAPLPDHVDLWEDPVADDRFRWDGEPVNTEPEVSVEVFPERPVEGDLVTVRIDWADAEANYIATQSWCHPEEPDGRGVCADGPMLNECPTSGPQALPPPRPGRGTLEFSFTARPGRHFWDHAATIRSVPAGEHSGCAPPDPYEDHFVVSGSIEVAVE